MMALFIRHVLTVPATILHLNNLCPEVGGVGRRMWEEWGGGCGRSGEEDVGGVGRRMWEECRGGCGRSAEKDVGGVGRRM